MKNKVFLIEIAVLLLSGVAVTVPVAAEESPGWHIMDYAPIDPDGKPQIFDAEWTGRLLRTENGIQFWELLGEQGKPMTGGSMTGGSMTGGMVMSDTWVRMIIMWDPATHMGDVSEFIHNSSHLQFAGWRGTIVNSSLFVYNFHVSGFGEGLFKPQSPAIWCDLLIWGNSFEGVYTPFDSGNPFVSGTSAATESATLKYFVPAYGSYAVGGEVVPVNGLALLAPWFVTTIAAITIGFAITKRKLFLH